MNSIAYYKNKEISDMEFPDPAKRRIGHLVRNVKPIPNYRAVVDRNTDRTFAIVKDGYKVVKHEDVINQMDELCAEFPEYGTPTREVWLSNYGGRMKTRWTFTDVDFEITTLSNGKPDIVHPTMETFASYDTSLAHRTLVGGFRVVCSNGMIVGKILGEYKRKHTASLELGIAKAVLTDGMREYSKATDLWISYANRNASITEINCYEEIGFNKNERASIEASIKSKGKVIQWDNEEKKNRKVEINAWELYNVLTQEASHRITDVKRQLKVTDNISKVFA
ncbi:MAG: hypothetical protein DRO67_00200 [Candidatus Asgardarchaeum californiense]|nr:MAG: hypothetical protein DRO67_00200 [Candidatus Asgardarchaeum californiense]